MPSVVLPAIEFPTAQDIQSPSENEQSFIDLYFTRRYLNYIWLSPSSFPSLPGHCAAIAAEITIFLFPLIASIAFFTDLFLAFSHCVCREKNANGANGEAEKNEDLQLGFKSVTDQSFEVEEEDLFAPADSESNRLSVAVARKKREIEFPFQSPSSTPTRCAQPITPHLSPIDKSDNARSATFQPAAILRHSAPMTPVLLSPSPVTPSRTLLCTPSPFNTAKKEVKRTTPIPSSIHRFPSLSSPYRTDEASL